MVDTNLADMSVSQRRLAIALAAQSPELRDCYLAALAATTTAAEPSRYLFVAAAARSLMEQAEKAGIPGSRPRNAADRLHPLLHKWGQAMDASTALGDEWVGSVIDAPLAAFLRAFADEATDYAETGRTQRQRALQIQRVFDPVGEAPPPTIEERRARWWAALWRHFCAVVHGEPRRWDAHTIERFEDLESLLLEYLEPPPSVNFARLDALLGVGHPQDDDVRRLRSLLITVADERYFFERLAEPAWLPALAADGWFSAPPPAIYESGYVRFPSWPRTLMLRRFAAGSPALVMEVMKAVPNTDNMEVYTNLVAAATAMPPRYAARWAADELDRFTGSEPLGSALAVHLQELVVKLAGDSQADVALALGYELLRFRPEVTEEEQVLPYYRIREPDPRFDKVLYATIFGDCAQSLVEVAPARTADMLIPLLLGAIGASLRIRAGAEPEHWHDASDLWFPSLADDDEESVDAHDLKALIAEVVRDATMAAVESGQSDVRDVVAQLEDLRWPFFRRLAMHLLTHHPEGAVDVIADYLGDPAVFETSVWQPEYDALATAQGGSLDDASLEKLRSWILAGPSAEVTERWLGRRAESEHGAVAEEDLQAFRCRWVWQRLGRIPSLLAGESMQQYEQLCGVYGQPPSPWRGPRVRTVLGDQSPVKAEQIDGMPDDELLELLRDWTESDADWGVTQSGLARALREAVAKAPRRFAALAPQFLTLPLVYCDALLWGLADSLRGQGEAFDWAPVLDFASAQLSWLLQPSDAVEDRGEGEACRLQMARLLATGLGESDRQIPANRERRVWSLLVVLASDDDPPAVPDAEQVPNSGWRSPLEEALNSVRSVAIEAVMLFACWLTRHGLAKRLDDRPEIGELLERHLDPTIDASPAVRSVFGHWYTGLHGLSSGWATDRLGDFFPLGKGRECLLLAAWQGYLRNQTLYLDVFDLLQPVYRRIIELAPDLEADGNSDLESTGRHLVLAYEAGEIALDDVSGLLHLFYQNCSDRAAASVLGFVARRLGGGEQRIDCSRLPRLQRLWEVRRDVCLEDPDLHREELGAFGGWFASGRFDDDWSLTELLGVVRLGIPVASEHRAMEHLALLAPEAVSECLECAERLLRMDTQGWHAMAWRDHVRAIVRAGLESDKAEVSDRARRLLDWLLSRSYGGYEDLLPPP